MSEQYDLIGVLLQDLNGELLLRTDDGVEWQLDTIIRVRDIGHRVQVTGWIDAPGAIVVESIGRPSHG